MADLLEKCSECYVVALSQCVEKIFINAGLTASTEYWYTITDKFGNKYRGKATTAVDGKLTIETKDLQAGLFTKYSGTFQLEIFTSATSCEPVELNLCSETYTCIKMSFEKIVGEEVTEQTIPCCEPEPVA